MGHVHEDANMFRTDGISKDGRRLCENDVSTIWKGQLLIDSIRSSDHILVGRGKRSERQQGKREGEGKNVAVVEDKAAKG